MKNTVIDFLDQLKRNRSRRRKTAAVLVCLSLIVAGGTTWALHINGESQAGETYCGYTEEHQHDDSCVEKVLVCGYDTEGNTGAETDLRTDDPEPETESGHTHSDSCYETQIVLMCAETEHTHSVENGCYDEDGTLACEIPEHTHSEENGCYTVESVLTCGLEEGGTEVSTGDAPEETETASEITHVHTDECYEITYICGFDYEHTHTLSCFSNPDADVETAADWEKTFANVELTSDFATDLVAIAKTQLGYTESTKNYQVVLDDEGNETTETKGYTRYGAWYGDAYGDWDALFVSFCLNYAEVPTAAFPRDASCPNWIETLSDPEKGYELYRVAADYSPYPGDLVFFDTDDDGEADHVGIVSELAPEYTGSEEYYEDDADYTLTGFKTIEGNSENKVKENEYELTDETILGYGALSTVVNDGTLAAYAEGENKEATEASVTYTHKYTETNADGTTGNTASWTDTVKAELSGDLGDTTGKTLNIKVYNDWNTAVGSSMENTDATAIAVSKAIATYLNSLSGLGEANTQDNNGWNDIQYYDIYWTDSSGNRVELPSGASVTLTWGETAGLYGRTDAGRIARVIAVSEDDLTTTPSFSNGDQRTITALQKDDTTDNGDGTTGITGFSSITFMTGDAPAAYAIVSDIVYTGYVSNVGVNYIKDGTAAFTDADGDGMDSGDSNGIVRTFDSIEYKYTVTMASRSDTFQPTDVKIWLSAEMPYCPTQAQFNTDLMTWANETGDWYIEYWGEDDDGNEKVLYYGASGLDKGYLYVVTDWNADGTAKITRDENGKVTGLDTTDLNTLAAGSDQGENSYMIDKITSQRFVASYVKRGTDSQPYVIPGSQDLIVGISVLNMKKDDKVEPTITAWLDGNEENLGYASSSDNKANTIATKQKNAIIYNGKFGTDANYAVTVTCKAMYNVEIKNNGYMDYSGWFDFSTGKQVTSSSSYTLSDGTTTVTNVYEILEALGRLKQNQGECDPTKYTNDESELSAEEEVVSLPDGVSLSDYSNIFANIRYGRIYGYGIDLQLANTKVGDAYIGMKGMSLPQGQISIDLNLNTQITKNQSTDDLTNYQIMLWDYNENVIESGNDGELGKNMYWNGDAYTKRAYGVIPLNSNPYLNSDETAKLKYDTCSSYQGGDWTLTAINNENLTGNTVGLTSNNSVYTFTISGYDFDLNDYTFPTWEWSGTDQYRQAYVDYEYVFSAGYVQALAVYPRASTGIVDCRADATVGNLNITTLSGDSVTSTTTGTTNIKTSDEVYSSDNKETKSVTITTVGWWTRRELVMDRQGWNPEQAHVLSSYWQYNDASLYLGNEFTFVSSIYLSAVSEYTVTACNYLQLFDTKSFRLDLSETGDSMTVKAFPSTFNTGEIAMLTMGTTSSYDTENSTYLYAADPDFPGGYDTNDGKTYDTDKGKGLTIEQYMNLVRENDLIYSDKTPNEDGTITVTIDGKEQNLMCVGVLAEFRGVTNFQKGVYFFNVRLPMVVTENAVPGTTASAVNCESVWVTENAMYNLDEDGNRTSSISWINGEWNSATGKNELKGYQEIISGKASDTGDGNEVDQYGKGIGWLLANTANGFSKLVYEDGQVVSGTMQNSTSGASALLKSYDAKVTIDSEKAEGEKTYNLANESGTVTYTIRSETDSSNSTAAENTVSFTDLTLTVTLTGDYGGSSLEGSDLDVDFLSNMYTMQIDDEEKRISSDKSAPTTFTWEGDDKKTYTASIYYEQDMDGKTVTFYLSNVSVNDTMPTITAYAQLGKSLPSGTNITATASIRGTGDTIGGKETDIVGIVNLGGTVLSKTVDKELMELDGTVTYTITYTNESENELELAYFYDFIPYNGDIRGTDYYDPSEHEETDTQHNGTFLFDISADSVLASGEDTGDFNATITFYYSTVDQEELRTTYGVEGFNDYNTGAVETMLESGKDSDDNPLFTVLGELSGTGNGGETKFTLTSKILEKYDKNNDGNVDEKDDENGENGLADFRSEVLANITCVYAKVKGMGANRSLNLYLSVRTEENEGADVYGNLAWAWVADSGTTGLRSGIVQTHVVSRSISGVVWYDADLDGVKDDGEKTLDGVTCTLFKWDSTQNKYVVCEEDVTGAKIDPCTTGGDGAYSFTKLSAGEYVVAFTLGNQYASSINGATTYQVNGKNDGTTNDGVALGTTASSMDKQGISFEGIDSEKYDYAIAYSLNGNTAGDMDLHTLLEYQTSTSGLECYSNYQENYVNQDLGLVYSIDYTLPKTGGTGTYMFTVGGLLLITVTLVYGCGLRRKRERRAK